MARGKRRQWRQRAAQGLLGRAGLEDVNAGAGGALGLRERFVLYPHGTGGKAAGPRVGPRELEY